MPWGLYKDAQERAFEVDNKGALKVTFELHLKMRMVVHLLGHRNAKSDSKIGKFEGAPSVESTPQISL